MQKRYPVLLFIVCCTVGSLFPQSSPVRVNQIGYELNGPKAAVYQAQSSSDVPSAFEIYNSQNTKVYSADVEKAGQVAGWSQGYFGVMDFSDFKTAGTYTIKAGSNTSFEFDIGENLLFNKTLEGLLSCFTKMRNTDETDKNVPLAPDKVKTVNLFGGYNEASGDDSKHITHLQYSNFMCSQETPGLTWGLLRAYELNSALIDKMNLKDKLFDEAAWGADYLMRCLSSEGYFYSTIFNGWGIIDRVVCAYVVLNLENDKFEISGNYQTAFREGGGISIAALAKAGAMGVSGEYTAAQYLDGAKKAYDHIKANNETYCDNGEPNLIDEYCAITAAIELYKATNDNKYKDDAGLWVDNLLTRLTTEGWFTTDDAEERPYFHAAEEGFPYIALAYYMTIDSGKNAQIREAIRKNLAWYFKITNEVTNPFNYVRLYARHFEADNNLALNKDVWAKTEEIDEIYYAVNAVDGNQQSFWLSKEKENEVDKTDWLAVDMGKTEEVYKVIINWEWQYAKKYILQISDDGNTWNDVDTVEITEEGPMETVFDQQLNTRYMRIYCLELAGDDPDKKGYGIHEFEIYQENNNTFFKKSFFIPHNNETGYWWQGENARLGSMAAGLLWAAKALDNNYEFGTDSITTLAMSQLDWVLGKNAYGVSQLFGYGTLYHEDYKPDPNSSMGSIVGGICNGITAGNEDENDIDFAPYPSGNDGWRNWRWLEQWLPHEVWYMFAISTISFMLHDSSTAIDFTYQNKVDNALSLQVAQSTVNGTFTILVNGKVDKSAAVRIYNMKGRVIKTLPYNGRPIILKGDLLSTGLYFVELVCDNKQMARRRVSIIK